MKLKELLETISDPTTVEIFIEYTNNIIHEHIYLNGYSPDNKKRITIEEFLKSNYPHINNKINHVCATSVQVPYTDDFEPVISIFVTYEC